MKTFTSIIKFLVQGLATLFETVFDILGTLGDSFQKNNGEYKAEFAPAGTVLSGWNYGFNLTGHSNLTLKDSYQNCLVVGGTGVGKTSVTILPSLFTMKGSFIVHDPSKENCMKSGGFLCYDKKFGVMRLNFMDASVSSFYNPMARANTSSEIQKLASMLVENALGKGSKDPFWNSQAVALLKLLITILKTQDKKFQNFYNVSQLLNQMGANPKAVDRLFSRHADDVLFAEYQSIISYDVKLKTSIIATCKSAVQIFTDETVARITSSDTINFKEFRDKPTVLYIQSSVADLKYFSVLISIFFEQFFAYVLSRFPEKGEQDIFFLIDECASLTLPTLPLAVANIRKHRAGAMLLLQDYNQLIHCYGKHEADSIRANCFAKMYFTGASLETARELEQTLGKHEVEDKDHKTKIRPLMTNDEIRMMKSNKALLITGNNPPIMARLKPYYKDFIFLQRSKIPAPIFKSESQTETLAILPLTTEDNEQAA